MVNGNYSKSNDLNFRGSHENFRESKGDNERVSNDIVRQCYENELMNESDSEHNFTPYTPRLEAQNVPSNQEKIF